MRHTTSGRRSKQAQHDCLATSGKCKKCVCKRLSIAATRENMLIKIIMMITQH